MRIKKYCKDFFFILIMEKELKPLKSISGQSEIFTAVIKINW